MPVFVVEKHFVVDGVYEQPAVVSLYFLRKVVGKQQRDVPFVVAVVEIAVLVQHEQAVGEGTQLRDVGVVEFFPAVDVVGYAVGRTAVERVVWHACSRGSFPGGPPR